MSKHDCSIQLLGWMEKALPDREHAKLQKKMSEEHIKVLITLRKDYVTALDQIITQGGARIYIPAE